MTHTCEEDGQSVAGRVLPLKRRFREKTERLAAQWLEVPADTLEHVARVTVIGNSQVIVENYRVLLEFTDRLMRIATSRGEIAVRGERLAFLSIVPEELVIEGLIAGVDVQ